MINLSPKRKFSRGAATLVTAVILFIVSSLIIIFAANYGIMQQKTIANVERNNQAFEAAEAGMEYAINYLQQNSSTILASPVNGYIPTYSDSNTNNVTLANNSRYTIVYSNPVAYNYNLIQITSTGTNSDGSSTRIITQQVQRGTLLANPGTTPLVTKGSVSMSGSSHIINLSDDQTINAGGGVTLGGSSSTTTQSGGSNPGTIGSDIDTNNSSLSSMTTSDFIASFFNIGSTSLLAGKVSNYYSNSSNTNYSTALNGMTGRSIFIDQTGGTATINGSTTIGSVTNPVILIVNGPFSLSGNVTIYGFVFIIGTSGITSTTGSVAIIGGIASVDDLTMSGSSDVIYNQTVLNNLQNLTSMQYFAKVPGSWKDY